MRIICPNCGEEPIKGQRHLCAAQPSPLGVPPPAPVAPVGRAVGGTAPGGPPRERRPARGAVTAQSLCASVGSLATKNKGLWKSKRSLARCGGEDCTAGD